MLWRRRFFWELASPGSVVFETVAAMACPRMPGAAYNYRITITRFGRHSYLNRPPAF
jgi:hypothetical protein